MGVLLLVSLIIAALAISGVGQAITDRTAEIDNRKADGRDCSFRLVAIAAAAEEIFLTPPSTSADGPGKGAGQALPTGRRQPARGNVGGTKPRNRWPPLTPTLAPAAGRELPRGRLQS
jgi:hypothetical protein